MMFIRVLVVITLFAALDAPAAGPGDEYDIYSDVLAHPNFSHPDENRVYLIADTTGPSFILGNPRTCIEVPDAYKQRFREVLADLERRNTERKHLQRALRIEKPYELLSEAEIREFWQDRFDQRPASEQNQRRFSGATDVITLSNVYFSVDRTLAIPAMSSTCG